MAGRRDSLHYVGFFRELDSQFQQAVDVERMSIHDALLADCNYREEQVLPHLEGGYILFDWMGFDTDVLDEDKRIRSGMSPRTDGE
jgi:hypothetical protein